MKRASLLLLFRKAFIACKETRLKIMTFLFSSDQGLDTLPAKRQDFTRTPIMARLFNDTMMSFASCLIPALFGIVCLSAPSVKLDDAPSDLEEMPKEIVNFADLSEYALFKAKLIAKPTS